MKTLQALSRTAAFCAAVGLSMAGSQSRAEGTAALADPTRPAGPVDHGAAPSRAPAIANTAAPVWPQLQSVQVSSQGGSSALVDGRIVRIGDRIGNTTVTAIDADGILLRGARFEQRIALSPGVAKTASAGAPTAPQTALSLATKEKQ